METLETLLSVASWVLPPLLGAIIGYVTNAIAIKMLFRPLRAIRVLGLKLPFTPGVIPRQRHQLAESIGRMVSRELITEETLSKQLESPRFREGFQESISAFTTEILSRPLGAYSTSPDGLVLDVIKKFISESLFRFFGSRSFIYASRGIVSRIVHYVWDRRPGELSSGLNLEAVVAKGLSAALTSVDLRRKVAVLLSKWVDELRDTGRNLEAFVTDEVVDTVATLFRSQIPHLKVSLFRWLRNDTTRRDLEVRGKSLLRDILARLNVLQKFIITAGQFDRTLEEKMPDIIDDVLDYFEQAADDEGNREKIEGVVRSSLAGWRRREFGEVITLPRDQMQERIERFLERVPDFFGDGRIEEKIADVLRGFLSDDDAPTVGAVIGKYLPVGESDIVEFVSFHLLSYLSQRQTAEMISEEVVRMVGGFLADKTEATPKELFGIDEDRKAKIDRFVCDRTLAIVGRKLPDLVRSFDVRSLVVDKINNLDVEDVERLLLQVIARHLRWINVFGGILGAIIGLSQLALRLAQRAF